FTSFSYYHFSRWPGSNAGFLLAGLQDLDTFPAGCDMYLLQLYELTFEQHPRYLSAHLKASKMDAGTAIGYWTVITGKCRDDGVSKLMVRQDIKNCQRDTIGT